MTKSAEANVVHTFPVPAVNVFDAWINADLVKLWMKDALKNRGLSGKIKQIEIDPQLGEGISYFLICRIQVKQCTGAPF